MTTYYKFLDANGKGQYSRYQWPLPTSNPDGTWTPGAWVAVTGKLRACRRGLHAIANVADLPHWVNVTLYTLEYDGTVVAAGDKVLGRRARLLDPLSGWDVTTLRWWALDCAEHVYPLWHAAHPGDTTLRDCLDTIRRYLRGESGREELQAARRAAAYAYAAYAADAAYAAAYAYATADADAYAYAAATAAAAAAAAATADDAAERQWQGERLLSYATGQLTPGQEVTP